MAIHRKFAIPFGVLRVRARLASALGATNGRDGKLASFVLGHRRHLRLLRDRLARPADGQGPVRAAVARNVGAEHRARRGGRRAAPVAGALRRPALAPAAAGAPATRRARTGAQPGRPRCVGAPDPRAVVVAIPARSGCRCPAEAARSLRGGDLLQGAWPSPSPGCSASSTSRRSSTCPTSCSRARRPARCCCSTFYFRDAAVRLLHRAALGAASRRWSTVGILTKNSELVVMKACGISLYRVASPMLARASSPAG